MKKIKAEIKRLGIHAWVTKVGGNFCVQRAGEHAPIAYGPTVKTCIEALNFWWETH